MNFDALNPEDRNRRAEVQAEEWLDAGLKELGEVEPRAGFETRILAHIQAQRASGWGRLWPQVAVAVALVVVAALVYPHRRGVEVTVSERPGANSNPATPEPSPSAPIAKVNSAVHMRTAGRTTPKALPPVSNHPDATPRLETFPSPAPLTQQEMMLAAYVREKPQEAQMVARVRADLLKRDLMEFEQTPGTPDEATRQNQE